ncbi:Protease synthase and sporulation negative regulatory protein PAI 1 [Alloiococcus otitis]|uniref:Ribosomal-protein-alanine acetyltransferase n=1 Tax=Alloiococcus otitis ATCC 51267 TaxID=883081 RepID=K9EVI3_9LACT|nr:ribosomal protein S18-alanine N-acetyltransferase [Alloiococcus otitis]EKU93225.1 ribosomal-protein-alanine acetyltransferase [Alloiococcus otitis ATCC 51267]SUU80563.1 Protease synthase and sporulation negative regulatory protein PAI 1 [Alloiococcus otitis]
MKNWIDQLQSWWTNIVGQVSLRDSSLPLIQESYTSQERVYQLKVGQKADAKSLVNLQETAYSPSEIWPESLLEREMSTKSNSLYLLLLYQDYPVAFIGAWIKGDNCHVSNLVVRPGYQRQGLGQFLLNQVEQVALNQNCHYYSLEVRESNHKAQKLYHKQGFETVGVKKEYYSNNREDGLAMVKQLILKD